MAENTIFTSETLDVLKNQGQIPEIILKKLELLVDKSADLLKNLLNEKELIKYQALIDETIEQQVTDEDSDDNVLEAAIDIKLENQTVHELVVRKWNHKQLVLNPDFQRNSVWKPHQKSQFIESILLNYPLPPFYFNVVIDNKKYKYVVVDGKQRLTTLHEFMQDEFRLRDLTILTQLNGKNFSELIEKDDTMRSKIEDKILHIYLIPAKVPIRFVYDIFNRINTGGTQLERQEIRNCIYLGTATRLLKQLANTQTFKNAIAYGISSNRMKDQEVVLHYLAFQLLDYRTQYKQMNDFLEDAMKLMNKPNLFSNENQSVIVANFERVMQCTYDFWGNRNFRIPTQYTRGVINIAVMESVCSFFAQQTEPFLERNKQIIQQNFNELLQNPIYIQSVRFSTGSIQQVKTRIELASKILSMNTI
jgi:uncharacterized protein with ParB-like and HNH nuclease domain